MGCRVARFSFTACVGMNMDLYCNWQGSRRLEQVFSSVCVFLTAIRRDLATVLIKDAGYSLSKVLVPYSYKKIVKYI